MKKNNKGFMLAEVVITSTIIITAMIGLYSSFQKLYATYNTRNNYYNIDGVYATKMMIDNLMNHDINEYLNSYSVESNYKFIIQSNSCTDSNEELKNTCEIIQSTYQVTNMIITEYDKKVLEEIKTKSLTQNETFKEYIDYLIDYYNIKKNTEQCNYIILTEIKEGDNFKYSNLRMR